AVDELRKQRKEARDAREMLSAIKKALAAAATLGRTNEGRQTFQTLLTVVAFEGGFNGIVQTQGRAPRRSPRPLGERQLAGCKVEARPFSDGSDARGRVLVRTPEQEERR
ncbi:unnamed protein product, partial [Ectocarpus sp. 4 AP-2014]